MGYIAELLENIVLFLPLIFALIALSQRNKCEKQKGKIILLSTLAIIFASMIVVIIHYIDSPFVWIWVGAAMFIIVGLARRDGLVLLLSLVLVVGCALTFTDDISFGNDNYDDSTVYYTSNGDGTCYISDCVDFDGTLAIDMYSPNGEIVVGVADYAFSFCNNIDEIILPNSVTRIGNGAFERCYDLTRVCIPESIEYIGDGAFSLCKDLIDLGTLHNVENYSTSLRYIGRDAFYNCHSLDLICLPSTVETIGQNAFLGCSQYLDIYCYVSDPAPYWIYETNSWNPSGCSIIFVDNETFYRNMFNYTSYGNGTCVVEGFKMNLKGDVEIPQYSPNGDVVIGIGDYAFSHHPEIQSIIIPEGIKFIGNGAFAECVNLQYVLIPTSIEQIKSFAFKGCTSLNYLGELEFVNDFATQLKEIGCNAFENCKLLNGITLPSTVEYLGANAFLGCSQDLDIYCYVSDPAQYWTNDVNSWNPEGCRVIFENLNDFLEEDSTFEFEFTLHENGVCAITGYKGELPEDLLIPTHSYDGAQVKYIYFNAFEGSNIRNVYIPEGIETIEFGAFKDCDSLECVYTPTTLTFIGPEAFKNCDVLREIYIHEGVTSICEEAFAESGNFLTITLPKSLSDIGNDLFRGCHENLVINCNLTYPPQNWLYNANAWNPDFLRMNFVNSSEVEVETDNMFLYYHFGSGTCSVRPISSNIEGEVVIPWSSPSGWVVTCIQPEAFMYNFNLKSVSIPDSVVYIGTNAFSGCETLEWVKLPESLVYVDDYAFTNCFSLREVKLPQSVKFIGKYSFASCRRLFLLSIPPFVVNVREHIFEDCNELTVYYGGYDMPETWSPNWNSNNNPIVFGEYYN